MNTEVVTELDRLEEFAPGWDELAHACSRPRSSPAWTLAWYRRALPPNTGIWAVIVKDRDAVVGTAPFFVLRTGFGFYRYELAAPMLHGVEPLAAPGREREVGETIGGLLASATPVPDIVSLDWGLADAPVAVAMGNGWPMSRRHVVAGAPFPAPRVIHGGGDFDAWLRQRSTKFRKSLRNDRNRLRAAGFEHRTWSQASDIMDRIPDTQRLYEYRRAARGGSGPTFDTTFAAVVSDAIAHSEEGRIRLSTLERPGQVIASALIISAGHESTAWIAGFDEEWAHCSPTRVNLTLCIEESITRGDEVFDLGSGGQSYKYRLTEDQTLRQHRSLSRRGLTPFHTPAQLLPFEARQAIVRSVGRLRSATVRRVRARR
jgi:CelD/BcsL family acetyltransferase involved in cellulose biosynthesis